KVTLNMLRLNCNLILLSSLTFYVVYDRTLRILIRVVEQRDGLYYFRRIQREKAYKSVAKIMCLKIKLVVCQRERQSSSSFSLCNHKIDSSFELIHCDM
ncbi:hypothetical protein CR513_52439, partial [Mucuna pruriens]